MHSNSSWTRGVHRAVRSSQSCSTETTTTTALFPRAPIITQVLAVSVNAVAIPAATLFNSFPKQISNKTVGGVQTEGGTMSVGLHVTFMLCKDSINWCRKTAYWVHLSNWQRPSRTMGSVDQKKDKRASNSWKEREGRFRNTTSFIKIVPTRLACNRVIAMCK